MLLQNITFSVSKANSGAFKDWIKVEIEEIEIWVEGINCYELLTEIDPESSNYSIQFAFANKEQYEIFKQLHFEVLLAKAQSEFSGQILYFNTLLQRF